MRCRITQTRAARYTSEQFQRLMAENGIVCSRSRSGDVWGNAAMQRFFSSPKTERTSNTIYWTRDETRADVFDYIERFYNTIRRHSTIAIPAWSSSSAGWDYLNPASIKAAADLKPPISALVVRQTPPGLELVAAIHHP